MSVSLKPYSADSGERIQLRKLPGVKTRHVPAASERAVLLGDHSDDGEHADSTVLQLGPAGVLEVRLDVGEAHGVETEVADQGGAVEFCGSLGGGWEVLVGVGVVG